MSHRRVGTIPHGAARVQKLLPGLLPCKGSLAEDLDVGVRHSGRPEVERVEQWLQFLLEAGARRERIR